MVDFPGFSLSGAVASFFLILLTMKRSDDFKVIGPAHPIVAKIGEDALLTCQLLPKRTAIHMEVRWYRSEPSTPVFTYRDGAEVTEMQSEEYRSRVEWIEDDTDKGSVALKIYNVQPSDHGQYWCHFQDGTYCAETSLQLKVAGLGSAPDIHMQGTVESRAQLVCTAEGWFPEPEVYWENTTGEKMLTFSEHHIQDEDGLFYVESTLVVRDASAETVSCVIHSPILSEEKGSAVSIPEKLQTELASLQVIGPSQPMLVRVGEDIQLTCYLSPKANAQSMEVRWLRAHRYPAVYVYKDGDHVAGEQMEEYKGRTVLVSDAIDEGRLTLQIHNARTSDDGQYRCLFEKDGVYQETSLDLKVAGMGSSPAITMKEWKDGEMQLICSSDGWFPQPHVQWRDTEGKTMPLFSEALTQGHHGLFHVETSLLVRNSSIVNVSCSISNSLLGQEETGTFSLSESRMTYSWKILPVLVVLLLVGAVSLNRRKSSKKVNVTLDPNTAHPELILSEGNKCVTRGHAWQKLPGAPQRFDCLPCVLGQQGFKSGRWHWEVEVGDGTGWFLGVVRDDVMRKRFVSVSPENGFWAMGCYGNEYWAITSPPTLLSLNVAPGRVRISLDYVSGHLSFYDMTNKCPIYTFSKCSFSGTLHPLFILWSPDIDYPDIFPVSRVSFVTSTKKTTTLDSGNQDVIPSSSTFLLSPSARRGLTRSSQSQLKSALTSLRLQI